MKRLIDFSSRFRILKGGKVSLVVSALIGSTTLSFAAPSGGIVTSGSANISSSGNTTNIIQNSGNVSINWDKFNIASNETVNFKQPNVNSIALNRVIGNEKSIINGALNANGQVWILNSNGVLFGKNAKINTAGLLATTKNLSDDDFNNKNYNFKGSSTESVINLGEIDISDSGYATLLANSVSNEGTIKAVKGSVRLIGADEVSINLNGNSIVDLTVNKGVLDSLVENKGAIYSDGGDIYLTTNAVDELLKGVVNNEGIIEANSLDGVTGFVELFAHGGEVEVGGTITALEGFVETSGKEFKVEDSFKIKAKEWLIDPTDITVESTGSTTDLTGSSIKASLIEDTLNGGTGVTLQADNNIYINENIDWTQSILFLRATTGDVNINSTLTASGTAGLSVTKGGDFNVAGKVNFTGANNYLSIDGKTYTIIKSLAELQDMNTNLTLSYALGSDIDASDTSTWNSGAGFIPIGTNYTSSFTGNFDGLGHTIDSLTINRPTENYIGLFGYTGVTNIKDITLSNVDVIGADYTGGMFGYNSNGTLANIHVSGKVKGEENVGGLAGYQGGTLDSSSFSGDVSNSPGFFEVIGGLVGYNNRDISNSNSSGTVKGYEIVGGLVGYNSEGSEVTNSYSTSDVEGAYSVGGLVGRNEVSLISNSYSTGSVTGVDENGYGIGGLVGVNESGEGPGVIENNYSTSNVSGFYAVGGLVGINNGIIKNSYAIGNATGIDYIGGLVGDNDTYGSIENSFWDIEKSGQTISAGGEGKTTAQLQDINTFKNDNSNWHIVEDSSIEKGTPILAWQVGKDGDEKPVWLIGTKVTVTEKPKPETEKEIEKVITTIVNNEAVKVPNPPKVKTTTPLNSGSNTNVAFNVGENKQIVSKPIEGQATQRVTLSEAKQMQQETTGQSVDEVRVPLSRSSIIQLVDGGVSLPDGVEQEFYVANNEK